MMHQFRSIVERCHSMRLVAAILLVFLPLSAIANERAALVVFAAKNGARALDGTIDGDFVAGTQRGIRAAYGSSE